MVLKKFIVSNHNSDCSWIKQYGYDYIVFDRSDTENFIFEKEKFKKVRNVGHNIYDYCMYFYDDYDMLPDYVCLLKGNMFYKRNNDWLAYKYITKEKFDTMIHNKFYTMLNSYTAHDNKNSFLTKEGGYLERNDETFHMMPESYRPVLKFKYFDRFDKMYRFIFDVKNVPNFLHFSPGACYIVPKEYITKYPKYFWLNMAKFIDHDNNPFESHMIERMLHMIFTENLTLNKIMTEKP